MKVYVFAIYLGLYRDDLVEIKVKAKDYNEALFKVKTVLRTQVDTDQTGLFLNDSYDD